MRWGKIIDALQEIPQMTLDEIREYLHGLDNDRESGLLDLEGSLLKGTWPEATVLNYLRTELGDHLGYLNSLAVLREGNELEQAGTLIIHLPDGSDRIVGLNDDELRERLLKVLEKQHTDHIKRTYRRKCRDE